MKHKIPHDISDALAKKATLKAFESYAERFSEYNPTADWISDSKANISFNAKGIKLDGVLELVPRGILLDMSVPFAFKLFQKKAIGVIEEEIKRWIERARNGEFDGEA